MAAIAISIPTTVAGVSATQASNRSRTHWINTSRLHLPGLPWAGSPEPPCTTGSGAGPSPLPIGRFGNAQVGSVVGPGTVNLSTGVSKTFSLSERFKLRAEGTFTNVLNHTNLSDPNMNITSPSFGLITSALTSDNGGARSGQVSARLDF